MTGITAYGRITPVAQLAALAVPTLCVSAARDALPGGHVAGPSGAIAALTTASRLAWIPEVPIVAHLTMITRITFRTLGAYVLRMLYQLELRIQVHVVVAL